MATDLGVDLIARQRRRRELRRGSRRLRARRRSARPAAEILRVEAGRPRFGREMTTATIPAEAGIDERAVSFTKGCYIGQETVARLHYKGKPNRHLRGLAARGARRPGRRDRVRRPRRGAGSARPCISPAHGPIALAVIRREAEPGATVEVGESGVGGQVVDLPF